MPSNLRSDLVDILQKVRAGLNTEINKDCEAGADEILNLVASKMPEKKAKDAVVLELWHEHIGWNAYHDSVKSILKGGTDE